MNKVILKGRLVRPIKTITTENGKTIGFITLAVWRGKYKEEDLGANFFDINLYEKNVNNFIDLNINKGSIIEVKGELFKHKSKTDKYEQIKVAMHTFELIENYVKDEDEQFIEESLLEEHFESI